YTPQLADTPRSQQLIQPYNHGTAPALAYSLMHLHKLDPDGVVAFFPSDHHFGSTDAFSQHVELAFAQAERDPERVGLLGIAPEAAEEAYGWIEPGDPLGRGIRAVRRFWEKPSKRIASRLMRQGCLWNSFVMVGRVSAFLDLIRQTLPGLLRA